MRPGDLVIWHTPGHSRVLAVVLYELIAYGGGSTGWWRILSGDSRVSLTRSGSCELLSEAP